MTTPTIFQAEWMTSPNTFKNADTSKPYFEAEAAVIRSQTKMLAEERFD